MWHAGYMTEKDVIGAKFSPGFSDDCTYWRVFIGRDRRLRQEVATCNFEGGNNCELLRYGAKLSRAEMSRLWEIIERIEFRKFKREYAPQTVIATDCETYRISVRLDGRPKDVEVYDPRRLVEADKNLDGAGFLELWEAIHQHAPHGKVPVEQGRPMPWWRFW